MMMKRFYSMGLSEYKPLLYMMNRQLMKHEKKFPLWSSDVQVNISAPSPKRIVSNFKSKNQTIPEWKWIKLDVENGSQKVQKSNKSDKNMKLMNSHQMESLLQREKELEPIHIYQISLAIQELSKKDWNASMKLLNLYIRCLKARDLLENWALPVKKMLMQCASNGDIQEMQKIMALISQCGIPLSGEFLGLLFQAFLARDNPTSSWTSARQLYSSLKDIIIPLSSMNAYLELAIQSGVDRFELNLILNDIMEQYPPNSFHKHHLKTLTLWIDSTTQLHELIDALEMSLQWGRLGFCSIQILYIKKLKELNGDVLDFKFALDRWAIPLHSDALELMNGGTMEDITLNNNSSEKKGLEDEVNQSVVF